LSKLARPVLGRSSSLWTAAQYWHIGRWDLRSSGWLRSE